MLVRVGEYWLNPDAVAAVKESSLDADKTCIWVTGASAVDGALLIDLPVEEVVELLNAAQVRALADSLLEDLETSASANG